jgi:hypothetical protein
MPTDTDDVRSSGQTGSEQSAVKPSLLTQSRRRAIQTSTRSTMRSASSTSLARYQAVLPIFMLPNKSSALTTANGSSLSEIASKFLKFFWVPLPGTVTWGKI